jgi:hypothetical protein
MSFIGQDHIIGPGRLLRRAIQADQLSSLIFFGHQARENNSRSDYCQYHSRSLHCD